MEAGGHAPSRAPSSPGFWPPGRRPTVAARGSRPSDGATTPRPARSPLHPAIAARAPSAAEFFPRASLGPRQRRRTSRPPTCAAITAVIVGAAPLGACACPACPPAIFTIQGFRRYAGVNSHHHPCTFTVGSLTKKKIKGQGPGLENVLCTGPGMTGSLSRILPPIIHLHHGRVLLWRPTRTSEIRSHAATHSVTDVDSWGGCWRRIAAGK